MSSSTNVLYIWPWNRPKEQAPVQSKKKTYVTNFVQGQGQSANDISLPQIATGGVVPFVLGRDIIRNPDMMWYGNLKPIIKSVANQDVVTNPDGSQTVTTTITTTVVAYTVDIQFCLGLGPGMRLRSILVDNVAVWTGTEGPDRTTFVVTGNDVINNVIFAGGEFDQAVDPYLQNLVDQDMTGYRGIAYVVLQALDTTKLSNISFEVDRYPDPLALGAHNKIGDDINPASAIAEIITRKWGGAGRDPAVIGASFTTEAERFFTEANGCSIVNRNNASANDINSILLDQVDATMWEDHELGTIEITSYRPNFDRSNCIRLFDRDITSISFPEKNSWQSVPTNISVKYVDRAQNYAEIPVGARNLAVSSKISKSGISLGFPAVRVGGLAAKILAREGASAGSPIQQAQLTTNRKTAASNPGDIILITCEKYGYFSVPAIVVKRRTQSVEDNSVTLVCNIILYPNNTVLFAAPQDSFFVPIDPNPHAPLSVKIFSAPWFLRMSSGAVNAFYDYNSATAIVQDYANDVPLVFGEAYNSSQTNMGGYYDFGGVDTRFYTGINWPVIPGLDFSYPIIGKLTGSIDKYDNWDGTTIDIVVHGLGKQNADLSSIMISLGNSLNMNALIWIDDELFVVDRGKNALANVTYNESLNTLTFSKCYRAYGDTVAQDHAANSTVYICSNTAPTNYEPKILFDYGDTPDFKFVGISYPKKVYTLSSISTALAYNDYTATNRAARPLRPHNTKIDGARDATPHALGLGDTGVVISWAIRSRVFPAGVLSRTPGVQLAASEAGEVLSGKHIVYRVKIIDSAAVEWDCGATADTADHSTLSITVPALAAAGNGWLYVQAEFTQPSGLKVSQYQDRLPIVLS